MTLQQDDRGDNGESRQLVIVTDLFPMPEQIIGGGQVRQYELATVATASGMPVTVIELRGAGAPRTHSPGVRVIPLGRSRRSRPVTEFLRPFRLLRVLRPLGGSSSILYLGVPRYMEIRWGLPLNLWSRLADLLLITLLRGRSAGLWVNVHDDWRQMSYQRAESKRLGLDPEPLISHLVRTAITWGQIRATARRADLVTVPSEAFLTDLAPEDESGRWRVWRAGARPSLARSSWDPPTDRWTVGYVGSPHDAQLGLLLAAVNATQHPDRLTVRLGMNGRPPPALLSYGDVPVDLRSDVRYADFDRFADDVDVWVVAHEGQPYLQRAWQLKLPMYAATGRPVVVSRFPELSATPLDGHLFTAGWTVQELAATIDQVLDDPSSSKQRAAQARHVVLEHMTWEATTGPLLELLKGGHDHE